MSYKIPPHLKGWTRDIIDFYYNGTEFSWENLQKALENRDHPTIFYEKDVAPGKGYRERIRAGYFTRPDVDQTKRFDAVRNLSAAHRCNPVLYPSNVELKPLIRRVRKRV